MTDVQTVQFLYEVYQVVHLHFLNISDVYNFVLTKQSFNSNIDKKVSKLKLLEKKATISDIAFTPSHKTWS